MFFGKTKGQYFCARDWTGQISLNGQGKFDFWHRRVWRGARAALSVEANVSSGPAAADRRRPRPGGSARTPPSSPPQTFPPRVGPLSPPTRTRAAVLGAMFVFEQFAVGGV